MESVVSCALRRDGAVICWGVGTKRDQFERDGDFDQAVTPLEPSAGGVVFKALSVGAYHSCALSEVGRVRCWGDQRFGQSVVPDETFSMISAGGAHTCGLTLTQDVICWGDDQFNQLTPPSGVRFQSVSAGFTHSCGVTVDGEGICWGDPDATLDLSSLKARFNQREAGSTHVPVDHTESTGGS